MNISDKIKIKDLVEILVKRNKKYSMVFKNISEIKFAVNCEYVSINNCKFILGVGVTSSSSKNLSMLNRVAAVKARRSVVLLLGNPRVTTQSFLKTEQVITDNSSSYIESFVDEIKEEASSFVQGMETLNSFYTNDGKEYVYVIFKKI